MPIKEQQSVVQAKPAAPVRQNIAVTVSAQAMVDANTRLVTELTSAIDRLTSGRKRVTIHVIERDRDGRIKKAIFDVEAVQ